MPPQNDRPITEPGTPVSPQANQTNEPKERGSAPEWAIALIGWVLQGGVLLSAAILVIGLLLLPTRPGGVSPQRLLVFPSTWGRLMSDLAQFSPQAIITVGLLVLIATPVMRVAVSVLTFALERDRKYVVITCLVLAILLFSIFFVGTSSSGQQAVAPTQVSFSAMVPLLIFLGAIIAGLLGSLVGLGGGVLIVPLLTLVFHLPIRFAIGASIISVIATSSGAAAAYVRDHMTNIRIGMFLEIATTIGAISGAFLAGLLAPNILAVVFGVILILSSSPLLRKMGRIFLKASTTIAWRPGFTWPAGIQTTAKGKRFPTRSRARPGGWQ